jgi:hypothetical protein
MLLQKISTNLQTKLKQLWHTENEEAVTAQK